MWKAFSISFTIVAMAVLAFGFLCLTGSPSSGAKLQRVDADFNAIGSSIEAYRRNTGSYPTTEQGIEALVSRPSSDRLPEKWEETANKVPEDPWETPYRYRLVSGSGKRAFEMISAGKDRKFGTKDDLSSLDTGTGK